MLFPPIKFADFFNPFFRALQQNVLGESQASSFSGQTI